MLSVASTSRVIVLPVRVLTKICIATSLILVQVESRFFCYVVVADGLIAIELLSTEDKPLLIRWDSFFILDLGLDHFDVVGWLDLESDGLAGEGAYKDLHELLMFFRELVDIIDYYYKLLIIYMISFNRAW